MSLYGRGSGLSRIHAVGAMVAVAMSTVAYVGFLRPLADRSDRINHTKGEMDSAAAQLAEIERSAATANSRITAVHRELADTGLDLQPGSALNRRLASLVTLGGESGLQIEESRAENAIDGSLFEIVPMYLEGQGAFSDCVRFLREVHAELADIDVAGFDLSRNPGDVAGQANFRFEFAWYAAREVAAAGSTP